MSVLLKGSALVLELSQMLFGRRWGKIKSVYQLVLGFPSGPGVKNLPANTGDAGSVPESGRSPGEGNGNESSVLSWRIPRTEEPGGLRSLGWQRVRHSLATTQQQHYTATTHLLVSCPVNKSCDGVPGHP